MIEEKMFFKDLKEGESFYFGTDIYIKTSFDRALTLSGSRIFNPMEIVKNKPEEEI